MRRSLISLGAGLTMTVLLALPALSQETVPPPDRVIAPPGSDVGLPFSAGILAEDFLFLSGAIANEPGTTRVSGDAAAQTRKTLANLGTVLDAAGLDFSRVVAAHVFLADARHYAVMNEVYGDYFADELPPTRTTVEADIAIPGALTEISMIAARPGVEVRLVRPEGWRPSALYSPGILAGDTLFLSGLVSNDPRTGDLVLGDLATQARQTLKNVGQVLDAADMGPENVVSCEVYLQDARHYDAMNEVYGAFFKPSADAVPPARATVRARLAHPELLIEITCVAVRGEKKLVLAAGASPSPRPLSAGILSGERERLYLSGMVGRGPDGYPASVAEQTRIALERLRATLEAAGMDYGDVESATVYLSDIRYYRAMNEIYREILPQPPPARATVGLQLMSPEALVEISMVASRPASTKEAAAKEIAVQEAVP